MSGNTFFYIPSWPVLYEDNHLLVLYKPAGLLVQGDETGEVSLMDLAKVWLKKRYHKPGRVFLGMVHRIDRPVAGVVLFCRTSKAAGRLSEQFRSGKVRKKYLAIVEGRPTKSSGRMIQHIERRDRVSRIVPAPTPRSQEARLTYQVLDTRECRSLVVVGLETGRRHQIRLQMAHLGCPIVGDLRYGAPKPLPQKQIALLAWQLTCIHPTRGDIVAIQSPLPSGWPWPAEIQRDDAPPWNWSDIHPWLSSPTDPLNIGDSCIVDEFMEE